MPTRRCAACDGTRGPGCEGDEAVERMVVYPAQLKETDEAGPVPWASGASAHTV